MKYVGAKPISREQAVTALSCGRAPEVCQALIDVAYFEPDGEWALEQALAFTGNDDENVANAATTAIGHLARTHPQLDMTRAISRLNELRSAPRTSLAAKYALEDIEVFRRRR